MDLAGNTKIVVFFVVYALMGKNSFNALNCENIYTLFLNLYSRERIQVIAFEKFWFYQVMIKEKVMCLLINQI